MIIDEHFKISGWTFLVHRHGERCSVTTEGGQPIALDSNGFEFEFDSLDAAVASAHEFVEIAEARQPRASLMVHKGGGR